MEVQETNVKMYNAGNLTLHVSFGFSEHKDMFSVSPTSLALKPRTDGNVNVAFHPRDETVRKFSS